VDDPPHATGAARGIGSAEVRLTQFPCLAGALPPGGRSALRPRNSCCRRNPTTPALAAAQRWPARAACRRIGHAAQAAPRGSLLQLRCPRTVYRCHGGPAGVGIGHRLPEDRNTPPAGSCLAKLVGQLARAPWRVAHNLPQRTAAQVAAAPAGARARAPGAEIANWRPGAGGRRPRRSNRTSSSFHPGFEGCAISRGSCRRRGRSGAAHHHAETFRVRGAPWSSGVPMAMHRARASALFGHDAAVLLEQHPSGEADQGGSSAASQRAIESCFAFYRISQDLDRVIGRAQSGCDGVECHAPEAEVGRHRELQWAD